MPRYWVISPQNASFPEVWDSVWQFDLENNIISIGWRELGDISGYNEDELKSAIENTYNIDNAGNKTLYFNMLWNFYHSIQIGDVIIARKGTKKIAAIGTVTKTAYYEQNKNIKASGAEHSHSNYLGVDWHIAPRNKVFDYAVFGMQTIYEIPDSRYRELVGETSEPISPENFEGVENQTEFILEKYLEDFIVTNFDSIFRGEIVLYQNPENGVVGQQYRTHQIGDIDILAQEPNTNSFVVIELKKGRESDKVVGQTLRYMGWVGENLCKNGQPVKGIIICRDADPRLIYALKAVSNITVRYYRIDFKLSDTPFKIVD